MAPNRKRLNNRKDTLAAPGKAAAGTAGLAEAAPSRTSARGFAARQKQHSSALTPTVVSLHIKTEPGLRVAAGVIQTHTGRQARLGPDTPLLTRPNLTSHTLRPRVP